MLERVRSALALMCVVVCVGSAAWMARSCFRSDQAGLSVGQGRLWLTTIDAKLVIAWDPSAILPPSFDTYDTASLRLALDTVWSNMSGIRALGIGWNMTGSQDERLILPLWLLPLLTAIPSVQWWRRARARQAVRGFSVEQPAARQSLV